MPVELVDTHCHLDFDRFDEDRPDVIRRALEAGVVRIVVPALDLTTSRAIVQMASDLPQVFAAVGIHPNEIDSVEDIDESLHLISQLAELPKVVAIGEIGLDYYWMKAPKPAQYEWLARQLDIAKKSALPVILHNRETTEDLYSMLANWMTSDLPEQLSQAPGVIHSFSGSWQDAQRFLNLGFYLGFSGPLTYKKASELRDVAVKVPLDRILVETDAPFLTAEPHRSKRNEPALIRFTAERLAELRGLDLETLSRITTENASQLFRWDIARTGS